MPIREQWLKIQGMAALLRVHYQFGEPEELTTYMMIFVLLQGH
jgi:hypothetical protein